MYSQKVKRLRFLNLVEGRLLIVAERTGPEIFHISLV